MVVNIAKSKQLGNQRSSGADKAISLTPPITFTLEEALEYIEDDELVEVTPQNIRLRKRMLSATDRKKLPRNNLSLCKNAPDLGAFLQEGNRASARANRRVYP